MSRLWMLLSIATLGAGCSFGPPTVACPDPFELAHLDCMRAVRLATAVLPADKRDYSLVNVEVRSEAGPRLMGESVIILKFSSSGGAQTFVRISRQTWQAEVFTPTPPPVPAAFGGSA